MEIIRLTSNDSASWSDAYHRAKDVLEAQGTVILPTDTVYGLSCNARNEVAVQKIFLVKKRDAGKPLPVFCRDIAQARSISIFNKIQECFMNNVWPGKVTVVVRKRPELTSLVTGGRETVGLRVPSHMFIDTLMDMVSFPLVGTSANVSGEEPFRDGRAAAMFFQEQSFKPDLIIDMGELPFSKPSTVVDLTTFAIVREGAVSKEEILERWGKCMVERAM